MPGVQKNFAYFLYTDDNGADWNVRGESGGAATAVDGHSTDYTAPPWGPNTRRRHVRYAVYQDATTFRTIKQIMYTAAALAALAAGDVVAVAVEGLAATVNYSLAAKIAEKQPIPKASRQLADHA